MRSYVEYLLNKREGAHQTMSASSFTLLLGHEDFEGQSAQNEKDKTIGVISKEPEQEMRRRRGAEDFAVALCSL